MQKTKKLHCHFRRMGTSMFVHVCDTRIDDELAAGITSDIKQRLDSSPECDHLSIDFSHVKQAGSTCLSLCLELNNLMELRGGTTVITGLNAHLDWLFRSVHLDKVLRVA